MAVLSFNDFYKSQKTYNKFIFEPNFVSVLCNKVACVALIPWQRAVEITRTKDWLD